MKYIYLTHRKLAQVCNLCRIKKTLNSISLIGFVLIPSLFFQSCKSQAQLVVNDGGTQGTTYHIVYESPKGIDLHAAIDSVLHNFDMSLSTYIPTSIISKVNNNEDVEVDHLFKEVFEKAAEISKLTEGAFDITVGPVVKAYGFGSDGIILADSTIIDSLIQFIGMEKVSIENNKVIKQFKEIKLDVNAIAQGYSADVVGEFLEENGIKNYLVEIGGEVLGKGTKHGNNWRIGVDKPIENNFSPGQNLQAIISLKDMALATSGNYRKFYVKDGMKIVHTINPVTGYPQQHNLLSASVIASTCMEADAYATVCMVNGLEKSIEMINANAELQAYFIFSDEEGNYKTYISDGLKEFIEETE